MENLTRRSFVGVAGAAAAAGLAAAGTAAAPAVLHGGR